MASNAATPSLLSTLAVEHPEWHPLLALIDETLRESARPQWRRGVPAAPTHPVADGWPLLDGAVINVAPRLIRRWIHRVLTTAFDTGTDVRPLTRGMAAGRLSPRELCETAMSQDVERLDDLAGRLEDDHGVLRALAPLIAMPLLQACRRAWEDRVPAQWPHGYCPLCGGRPALAESRGLEGARYLRCGACGTAWRIEWLRCPFCGEGDHEQLGALVSAATAERQRIDVCDGCHRYVKSLTTLTPIPPEEVLLHDLATVVLDVAALERDYHRPAATTRRVDVTVVMEPSRLRDLFGLGS